MGETTGIAWCDHTWNPWVGCARVSAGCDACYMFAEQTRYGNDPATVRRTARATFNAPLKWKNGRVFTCSWSDWFITDADAWRPDAWEIIKRTPHLTYQILTKRPVLIERRLPPDWGDGYPNVWLGVSVENREQLKRLDILKKIPNRVPWASFEPLLEDLGDLSEYQWLRWAVWGGESGPKARPFIPDWPRNGMPQLPTTAHFVKQMGSFVVDDSEKQMGAGFRTTEFVEQRWPEGTRMESMGHESIAQFVTRDRKGGEPAEWPNDLRVRQYPD